MGTHLNPQYAEVLIVDDRPENLLALEASLESRDYTVVKANSGYEALRYLLHFEPALILMDVQMPGLDGFETVALLKKSERTRSIPIIFLTAINIDEKYARRGYQYGAVDYIYKPFDSDILRSKVSVFVDLHKKSRQLIEVQKLLAEGERTARAHEIAQLEVMSLKRERAEQKKYRELVDGIQHGFVWSIDALTMQPIFISKSAESILGYPLTSLLNEGNFLEKHLTPEDRESFSKTIRNLKKTDHDSGMEHRFVRSDGKTTWLHTGVQLTDNGDGTRDEIRGLSVDITELKQANQMVENAHLRAELLSEASRILSDTVDSGPNFKLLAEGLVPKFANLVYIELHPEFDPVETVEASAAVEPEHSRLRQLRNALELGRSMVKENSEFPAEYPRSIPLIAGFENLLAEPIYIRGNCRGSVCISFKDSTTEYSDEDSLMVKDLARRIAVAADNAHLYRKAQDAIRSRDEFLSIASHELKTPLTPLKLQTQSLLRAVKSGKITSLGPERMERMLETSDRQIDRLTRLIEELLDISRITSGKLELAPTHFDLVALIRETMDRFSDQMSHSGSKIELDLPESLLVHWDSFRIEQVLVNLLTNAIKYGDGKPIEIHGAEKDGYVDLLFRDHGIGIAAEDHARIFARFERAVSSSHFGGLGLGLYIVSQIVDSHSGKITVDSEVGLGSTFRVRIAADPIPLRDSSKSGSHRAGSPHSPTSTLEVFP